MLDRLFRQQARLFPNGYMDVVRQVLLFAVAYYGYRLVRGVVDDPAGTAVAFENARRLMSIESSLHLFVEPTLQSWAQSVPLINDIASWLYINAQFSITMGALVYLYLRHNPSFYFVRNMFMFAMGIALVGYILYPCAPPRFFPEWGFYDSVAAFTHVDHNSVAANALFNPYAAVPSMHVCFALMIGIPLSRLAVRRSVRIFWAGYPVLVTVVIVTTANHFLADALLGALTAGLAAYGARGLALARPTAWAFSPARA